MENEEIRKEYRNDLFIDFSISTIFLGSLFMTTYSIIKDYTLEKQYKSKIMQIKSIEDRDNIKGYDTMILEDRGAFKLERVR